MRLTLRNCCGDRFKPAEHGRRFVQAQPAAHGVANRFGLLEDLLEHVVRIAVELRRRRPSMSSTLDVVGRRGPDRDG